jgi:hypothetical protein
VRGKVNLFVYRKKWYKEKVENGGMQKWFEAEERYYLERDSVVYEVRSKSSLLKALSDEKKALKAFFKEQPLLFPAYRERLIREALLFYNALKES